MKGRIVRTTQKRRARRVRRYTTLGCPMVRNRASWCMGLCTPVDGRGTCGRLAPHDLVGKTQKAIARYNASTDGKGS